MPGDTYAAIPPGKQIRAFFGAEAWFETDVFQEA